MRAGVGLNVGFRVKGKGKVIIDVKTLTGLLTLLLGHRTDMRDTVWIMGID